MTKEYICPLYFKDEYETQILKLIIQLRHLNFDFCFSRKENNIFCFSFTDHNDMEQAKLIAILNCNLELVKVGKK